MLPEYTLHDAIANHQVSTVRSLSHTIDFDKDAWLWPLEKPWDIAIRYYCSHAYLYAAIQSTSPTDTSIIKLLAKEMQKQSKLQAQNGQYYSADESQWDRGIEKLFNTIQVGGEQHKENFTKKTKTVTYPQIQRAITLALEESDSLLSFSGLKRRLGF